jgi:CubicO group peptidase (beta-lactamase class C family)
MTSRSSRPLGLASRRFNSTVSNDQRRSGSPSESPGWKPQRDFRDLIVATRPQVVSAACISSIDARRDLDQNLRAKETVNRPAIAVSVVLAVAGSAPLSACLPSRAGSSGTKVDALFAEWNRSDSPGCAVGISRNGAVLYEHGYGMANLELGVPIRTDTVFAIASVSKPFTASSHSTTRCRSTSRNGSIATITSPSGTC